jgi:hypothetical protein
LRDRAHQGSRALVPENVTDERAIDLERRELQVLQMRQRAQAGAEIVERETTAAPAQAAHQRSRLLQVADGGVFGELERQPVTVDAAGIESGQQPAGEGGVVEGRPGQIDGDMQRLEARPRAGGAHVLEHIGDDAAIDLRQQLITRRRRHEIGRRQQLAFLIDDPQQHLVAMHRVGRQ